MPMKYLVIPIDYEEYRRYTVEADSSEAAQEALGSTIPLRAGGRYLVARIEGYVVAERPVEVVVQEVDQQTFEDKL